jgi:hypothetical protein
VRLSVQQYVPECTIIYRNKWLNVQQYVIDLEQFLPEYIAICDRGVNVYETGFQEYANECRVICEWLYSN